MAENTIIHEISLAGYKATSTGGMLDLGTWGSYGIEKLHLTLDAAWQDLTITAFFNVNGKVVAKRVVGKDGYADVPWEATKENTFSGCLAFEGSINGQRRISTNLNYKVTNHSETTDSDPVPTDDRWNQFVTETKEYRDGAFEAAEKANARAEDAETASEGAQAAARAAKASENAAAASASNAAADAGKAGPYAKAAQAAQEAAENAAAAAAASKSAADTLAAEAARAAKAAENSKAAANNAAYFAGENATAAQKAAATATAAANDAGQSASAAAASKAAAETAAKAAQDAQTATAAAKEEAVKAQGAAQTAAKSAQDAQAAAENVRDDAQTAQKGAEAARDAAAKSAEAAAKSEANVKQSADTLAESVKNITPDDSSIGDKPWSSKHIIDMLCPPLEESGNPVVCYPVAGYPLGVKASWEPVQEGSGDPSPDNVRQIKGRDSVKVERCGENLLNIKPFNKDTNNGITYEYVSDGGIHISGTALANSDSPTFPVWHLPPGKYHGLNLGEGTVDSLVVNRNGMNYWISVKSTFEILAGDICRYWYTLVKSGITIDKTVYPYIVPGTTAPTTYTPYIGQTNTLTLTLPETVYGGTVDAVTGEEQETWKVLNNFNNYTFSEGDSEAGWTQSEDAVAWFTNDLQAASNESNVLSNVLHAISNIVTSAVPYTIGATTTYCALRLPRSVAATGDDVKNWLKVNDAKIAFKGKEQTLFTATGAQPIPALAGANTVLTNADSATVTGRADPIKRITDLEAAVASIN